MLLDRVERFIRDPGSDHFDELAREAFRFQYDRLGPYRRLCQRAGVSPAEIEDWHQIPAVPALAFKTVDLSVGDGEIFRSSGTTTERTSLHRHAFPQLYRASIDASFPDCVLGSQESRPMLSLIPDRAQAPESSLSFMIDHILARWASAGSLTAFGPRGVDPRPARSFLGARQRSAQPVVILSTAFALVDLLEALERYDLRFRLPSGSVVFETGGYKGRQRQVPPEEVVARLDERLDIPASAVVREYGMTELTSQMYTRTRAGGDPFVFVPPPWMRVRILDPATLEEAESGVTGLISVFDLANLSSVVHLLTEDLGVAEGGGFRLRGRAAGAELRGCSLTVEELTQP